jgi:hypothetical protein
MTIKDDKTGADDNVLEIGGEKFTVTPKFKKAYVDEVTGLTAKVTTLETKNQTLSQQIDSLKKPASSNNADDGDGDDDENIGFDALVDNPSAAINKQLNKTLKKLGLTPGSKLDPADTEKRIEMKMQLREFWADFYREHTYFDKDDHDDLIQLQARKLFPQIKDMPARKARVLIAEKVASMLGRAIQNGKLIAKTDAKNKANPGIILEGADGTDLDNSENTNDTKRQGQGTLSDILKAKREARRSGGKKPAAN